MEVDADGYSSDIPTEEGWYDVDWGDGEPPELVYIWIGERFPLWGWHPHDDPEAIDLEASWADGIMFRKAGEPA